MSILDVANDLARQVEASGRLGTLVAVRWTASLTEGSDLAAFVAQAAEMACGWLADEPATMLARGDWQRTGHVQIATRRGRSLLVVVHSTPAQPTLDLVLVGSRGIAHGPRLTTECHVAGNEPSLPHSPRAEPLAHALDVARTSAHPVAVDAPVAEGESPLSISPVTPRRTPSRFAPVSTPLGVLLVAGSHSHQENYARAFAADPRCRLIGLVDESGLPARRQELNAQLAQELKIPLFDDLDAALGRDDVQVVSICAAPERRARLIQRVAERGKQVYLDKPLAATIEEADAIVEAFARGGSQSQMFSLVHTRFQQRVRQVVESGRLGTLRAVHCDAFFAKGPTGTARLDAPRRETSRPTRFETIEAKRELHNVGVYSLVLLRWLTGLDVRRVTANTANYFFAEHQREDMEDFAQVTLELDGGLQASIATGRTGWRSHPSGGMNRVLLIGDRDSAWVDAHEPRLEVWADEAPWTPPRRHPEDPMGFWTSTSTAAGAKPKLAWLTPAETTDDVRAFVDALVAGRASQLPVGDAAQVMETLLAAYASAASGRAVALPLPRA